ncbi:MAG: hypothetical protein J0M33_26165 [Anaerolineae bacterium]|nr:hypothetical protein [Anaerolineae bacterium]
MVKRLLEATARDFAGMNGAELAESIRLAEGRTLAVEVLSSTEPPIEGISGGELAAAMGADLIVLDGYDPLKPRIAGVDAHFWEQEPAPGFESIGSDELLRRYSAMLGRPVGINLIVAEESKAASLGGRRFSSQSATQAIAQGADLIFLYARPHQGGTPAMQAEAARWMIQEFGVQSLLVGVPTFSHPPPRDERNRSSLRDQALALLDAGCAGAAFPMTGSKQGWLPEATAALIDSVHVRGGLAWLFVTGSIEGAPPAVIHDLALLGKQLGADAFRLDEAGLSGMPPPENIHAFSLALRGARHTYRRMASSVWR